MTASDDARILREQALEQGAEESRAARLTRAEAELESMRARRAGISSFRLPPNDVAWMDLLAEKMSGETLHSKITRTDVVKAMTRLARQDTTALESELLAERERRLGAAL